MGKRPSEHRGLRIRWRRRLRNARRRVYGWGASALAAAVIRVPYRAQRAFSLACCQPLLRLMFTRAARRNLSRAFPDMPPAKRRTVLRQMFRGTAGLGAECAGFAAAGPRFFDLYFDDAAARRHIARLEADWDGGWIALTGHLGNWELAAQWLTHVSKRRSAGVIAKRQPNPHLNEVIARFRGRHGMATLYRDEPPGRLVRLLRAGQSIGTAADQDTPSVAGVFLDFLGRPAYTPLGPARLALAAGVPIVVGAVLRTNRRFCVQVNPPIFPDRTRPKEEEVLRITREWSRQIEQLVREHPEQWPWFHDRWRTTPDSLAARDRRTLQIGGGSERLRRSASRTGQPA